MLRNVELSEISDGKLYDANDMVKADCHDCEGCCDCCRGMGNTVVLDPLDVHRLSVFLKKTPEELIGREIALDVFDGNILPHLCMTGSGEQCVFLNARGRCSIHQARPGFCRLFPLGRYYENGSFRYFLQVHECPKTNRSKIKVRKWIDTPDVKTYEAFVSDWHYFLKDVAEALKKEGADTQMVKQVNIYVLKEFYMRGFDENRNFYAQFAERLSEVQAVLLK